MTPPRLSICIATLNRAAFIGHTLESIIAQATDEVEIVVVDGASTDNTEEVVRAFAARFPRLRYVRLAEKGGVDADYDRAVGEAQGVHCWLFSDDDLLKPGAIVAVLRELNHGFDLIVVNAEARSADLAELQQERILPVAEDRTYGPDEHERLFVDTAKYLTFIGCVVIRRALWLARERPKYYGSAFIHVGVIFQAPLPGPALLMSLPRIVIRYGNASWTARAFDIWMLQWPKLVWSLPGISNAAKRSVVRKEPWRSPAHMLFSRAMDAYSIETYRERYAPLLRSWRDRAIAQAIARVPGPIANAAALAAFRLRGSGDRLVEMNFTRSRFYYRNVLARANWRRGEDAPA